MTNSWSNHRCVKGKMPNFNGPPIKPSKMAFSSIKAKPFNKDGTPNVRFPQNASRSMYGFNHTKIVKTSGDVYVRGTVRKKPERKTPYPKHTTRVPILKRERATCIAQRKAGLPINMISKFLGRSTSWVHYTLRTQILNGFLRVMDMRKLPGNTRISTSGQRWRKLLKLWSQWEAFLYGEEDKPP